MKKNKKNFIEARVNPQGLLFSAYCRWSVTDRMLGGFHLKRRSFGEIVCVQTQATVRVIKHNSLVCLAEHKKGGIVVTRGR